MTGLALGLLSLCAPAAQARLLMSQKDALALAFPEPIKIERRTAYLSESQAAAAQAEARSKIEQRVWTYYVGTDASGAAGYAYFESHVVRTANETFMVALDSAGSVRFIELLAFAEPEDYKPGARWLEQFKNRKLDDDLLLRRGIRNITGASLTSEALTAGVRRVLAVHRLIHETKPR